MPSPAFWRGLPGGGERSRAGKLRMRREATSARVRGEETRLQETLTPAPGLGFCGACASQRRGGAPLSLAPDPCRPALPPGESAQEGDSISKVSARCPAPAAPAAPAAGQTGTCCHLRTAGLNAAKPPSPDPRPARPRSGPRSAGPAPHPLPGRAGQGEAAPRAGASAGPLRRAEPGRALPVGWALRPPPQLPPGAPGPPPGPASAPRRPRKRRCP